MESSLARAIHLRGGRAGTLSGDLEGQCLGQVGGSRESRGGCCQARKAVREVVMRRSRLLAWTSGQVDGGRPHGGREQACVHRCKHIYVTPVPLVMHIHA